MSIPVVTAIADTRAESSLVAALDGRDRPLEVVRRCVDVADLLAAAQAGLARAALVGPGLRRFDRDALGRLAAAGVAVVGVAPAGDEDAERRLRQLGVDVVTPLEPDADVLASAVRDALARDADRATSVESWLHHADRALPDAPAAEPELDPSASRLIACWGPTGAPGRTSVAVGLATEIAAADVSTLLVDADTYGGTVAQVLGLLDESSGLAAVARQANVGTLDAAALREAVRRLTPRLGVLTGLVRPDRWPELARSALDRVWEMTGAVAATTVVDCGFSLEEDEELSYDTLAPRRNAATLSALAAADDVVAVCAADAPGIQRFVRAAAELQELLGTARLHVICTRVRSGPVGPRPGAQVAAALERYAGIAPAALIPDDRDACDRALARGRSLLEVAPRSPARLALRDFALDIGGIESPDRSSRKLFVRRR
ncbi:MAG: AAA family ATPase [Streptosporangiales bacterium]